MRMFDASAARGWTTTVPALFLCLGMAFSAGAAGGRRQVSHVWLREDGLPQSAVSAVTQTRDGYIWVGTYNGLARFDGARFVNYDSINTPGMANSRITCLFEAPDGALWIGCDGGEVTRYWNGRFEPVAGEPRGRTRSVVSIGSDASGDLWLLNEEGVLWRMRDGQTLTPEAGALSDSADMARSGDGTIWILRSGRVSVLRDGQLQALRFDAAAQNTKVLGIGAGGDGGLWVIADYNRVAKWKDGAWHEPRRLGPAMGKGCQLEEIGNGILAAAWDRGLVLVFPDGRIEPFDLNSGLPSDWVRAIYGDHEGNLWVGTGFGLALIRECNVRAVAPPGGWQGRCVLSVSSDRDGALWVGTEGAGVYRYQDGKWRNYSAADGLSNNYVWCVMPDAGGRLWAGTWGGGLFVKTGDRFERAPGLESDYTPMLALMPEGDGAFWAGTREGPMYYREGKATWFRGRDPDIRNDVRTVARAADGTVWFGTTGRGLLHLKGEDLENFRKADGLPTDCIRCLHPDGDALWIGTFGGGLCRLRDGRFVTIGRKQGLPDSIIYAIEDDGRGFFWMSSCTGIIRVSKEELDRCADGKTNVVHCLNFGISDGMPTLECSGGFQPASCKTPDGLLWFPTRRGLVKVDPADIQFNPLPPRVQIEELLVDNQMVGEWPAIGSDLKIAPGARRWEFRYTALSFADPEGVRFQCRLDGVDSGWINVGARRTANYNHLSPGKYTFRVIACNSNGVWNRRGAELAFTVLPYFWQTLWFRALAFTGVVAAASGTAWYGTRRRMRRKLELLERQRAVERERTRIARDIHDDLGASLTRINLLNQSASRGVGGPAQVAEDLGRIGDTVRESMRTMDEIVWAVDPKHDTLDSLASYLGKVAADLLKVAGIRCRLDFPTRLPPWPLATEVRHNLFLAFKEALHNVIKHSGASEAAISLEADPAGFAFIVQDNGRGFDAAGCETKIVDGGGHGLPNMRRRLRGIGGHAEIQSERGRGTRIKLSMKMKGME